MGRNKTISNQKKKRVPKNPSKNRRIQLFSCNLCDKDFRYKTALDNHTRVHHKYKCQHCREQFDSLFEVSRHEKSHASDLRYSCEVCDKKFLTKQYMLSHKTVHYSLSYLNAVARHEKTVAALNNDDSAAIREQEGICQESSEDENQNLTKLQGV